MQLYLSFTKVKFKVKHFWIYLLKHCSSPQVRKESIFEKFEEKIAIFNSVNAFEEESHALLVVRHQPGRHVRLAGVSDDTCNHF